MICVYFLISMVLLQGVHVDGHEIKMNVFLQVIFFFLQVIVKPFFDDMIYHVWCKHLNELSPHR